MSARRTPAVSLDDAARKLLREIAADLRNYAYNGIALPGWLAAARSEQLRRIADPDARPILTESILREQAYALSYTIRRQLFPKEWKKSRGEVAALYGVTDPMVSSRATKHKKYVQAWLARMPSNLEYEGLSRDEMLKRELASIEEHLPKATRKP
jgi:hypothetical protein